VAAFELAAAIAATHVVLESVPNVEARPPLSRAALIASGEYLPTDSALRRQPRCPRDAATGCQCAGSPPDLRPTVLSAPRGQDDYNDLVGSVWMRVARQAAFLAVWWVPSKLNVADIPTRPAKRRADFDAMLSAGYEQVEWRWPSSVLWQ
jgi:hypothetical protein